MLNYYFRVLRVHAGLLDTQLQGEHLFFLLCHLFFQSLVFKEVLARHVSLLLQFCRDSGKMFALEFQVVIEDLFVLWIVRPQPLELEHFFFVGFYLFCDLRLVFPQLFKLLGGWLKPL